MPTVTLAGSEYEVRIPRAFSARQDAEAALLGSASVPFRSFGALVGLCVPGAQVSETLARHRHDVLAYGGACADQLIERGATAEELLTAGVLIAKVMAESRKPVVTAAEVSAAKDFSEGAGEGSTSSA